MMKTNLGTIYPADNRTVTENREGVFIRIMEGSSLYFFQEVVLKKSAQVVFDVEESSFIILIPVSGEMNFQSDIAHSSLNTEEVLICRMPAKQRFQINNNYPDFRINYLHLQVKTPVSIIEGSPTILNFSLDAHLNSLIPLIQPGFHGVLNIGKFQERKEMSYKTKTTGSRLYAYVLAGAFEFEGKLLQPGDGLELCDIEEVGIAVLSNNSIIFLVELMIDK